MRAPSRRECPGGIVWYDGPHAVSIDSFRMRLLSARARVSRPRLTRFYRHYTWHVCLPDQRQHLADEAAWIEVVW